MASSAAAPALSAASKTRLRTWLKVLKTARHIEKELRERFRDELDSTLPRFDVMAALARAAGGLRMTELSGELKVSGGNVTHIVDRLTDAGIVERKAVEGDRRAQLIELTPAGRETFTEHAQIHEQWVDELLDGLPAAEAEELLHLLDLVTPKDDL